MKGYFAWLSQLQLHYCTFMHMICILAIKMLWNITKSSMHGGVCKTIGCFHYMYGRLEVRLQRCVQLLTLYRGYLYWAVYTAILTSYVDYMAMYS